MISFKEFQSNISEKVFDGKFYKKSPQDEALEVLQMFGKVVDGRKVREDRLALREDVYVLIKRPLTAVGEGYLILIVVEGSYNERGEADAKVIKNYGGNDFQVGSKISITSADCFAVSEDNKRYYIVYPVESVAPKDTNGNGKDKENGDDGEGKNGKLAMLKKMELG